LVATGSHPSTSTAAELIADARKGVSHRLGQLLELHRSFLRLLATARLDRKLRARVCPSDLVQETMLEAIRDFAQFRGQAEAEFLAWLWRKWIARAAPFGAFGCARSENCGGCPRRSWTHHARRRRKAVAAATSLAQ